MFYINETRERKITKTYKNNFKNLSNPLTKFQNYKILRPILRNFSIQNLSYKSIHQMSHFLSTNEILKIP